MNILIILRKLLILIVIAGLGGLLYALCANILIMSGMMPAQDVDTAPGFQMTEKAVYVWMGTILLAVPAMFLLQQSWRWIFITAPLYAPSVFALFFILTN